MPSSRCRSPCGRCRRRSPPSPSTRRGCGCTSAVSTPRRRQRRPVVLQIEYAYWLMAAFFAVTAAINVRQRRWIATAFWGLLALLFAGGDHILAAAKSGDHGPGQLAGLGVLGLALLAPRMRRMHLPERDEQARAASAARLRGRLFLPAL